MSVTLKTNVNKNEEIVNQSLSTNIKEVKLKKIGFENYKLLLQ